jgi:zinc transport system substrate-binding protein
VVSIPPLKGLVEPLLPPGSTVDVLIPPGVSEHGYEIPPSGIARLARAGLVVYVGLGLEPAVERFLREHPSPARRMVRFAEAAGVDGGEACDHDHGDGDAGGAHDHVHRHGADPHLWLDPLMALRLVDAVAESLHGGPLPTPGPGAGAGGADGGAADRLRERRDRLKERIEAEVHAAYQDALGRAPRRTIIVAHDAYGWLAKRYGLEVVAISGLNATEPTPAAVAEAARAVRERGVRAVFVEPQMSQSAARRIAEATGARVLTLDPLGRGDWFALMQANLDALKAALTDPPPDDPASPRGGP